MFYQAITQGETGNVNNFWLISEFLRNLEESHSKKHHYSEVFHQGFSQNKPWGVLGRPFFCSNVTTVIFVFPAKAFYTEKVTNILHFHPKGRFQSTFVNVQTVIGFLQQCTRELTDQSQSLGKHNKKTYQSKQPNGSILRVTFLKLLPSHILGWHSSRIFQSLGGTIYLEIHSSS